MHGLCKMYGAVGIIWVVGVTRAGLKDGQVYELARGTRYGGLDLAPCHPPACCIGDAQQKRKAQPDHRVTEY